jgi:hypothetical protein
MLPSDLFLVSFTFPKDYLSSEELKQHEQWLDEKCSVIRSKGSRSNCSRVESKEN